MENSSKNNIDDIFKKTFEGFENEPSGRVWGNVKEALRSKGRRSAFMSLTSVLMVLGVVGVMTYALINNETAVQSAQQTAAEQVNASADIQPAGKSLSSGSIATQNNSVSAPAATSPVNNIATVTAASPRINPVINNSRPFTGSRTAAGSKPANVTVNDNTVQPEVAQDLTTKAETKSEVSASGVNNENKPEELSEGTTSVPQPEVADNADSDFHPDNSAKKKDADIAGDIFKVKDVVKKTKQRRTPFTNPNKSGPAIIAYYSPEISFRSLSSKDANYDNMIIVRNRFEKPKYAYSYGIKLEYQFKKHLAVQLGIAYAERGERAHYSNQTIEVGPFRQAVTVTQDPQVRAKNTYNTYKFIEFPITVSYWLGKSRSLMAISGGVTISDLIGSEATYMTQSNNETFLVRNVNFSELRQTTYSAVGGFSYSYRISPTFSILLDPFFRYSLSNTNKAMQVKEHQYSGGINIGLRYKISSKNFPRY